MNKRVFLPFARCKITAQTTSWMRDVKKQRKIISLCSDLKSQLKNKCKSIPSSPTDLLWRGSYYRATFN